MNEHEVPLVFDLPDIAREIEKEFPGTIEREAVRKLWRGEHREDST